MQHSSDIQHIIEHARDKGHHFALYRLPGADTCHSVSSPRIITPDSDTLCSRDAFAISRFDGTNTLLIPSDESTQIPVATLSDTILSQIDKPSLSAATPPMPEHYAQDIEALIERINQRSGGKTVYATTRRGHIQIPIHEAFSILCLKYPDAFIYCWHIVGEPYIWLGATPELLLRTHHSTLHTMALAGTRPAGTTEPWDTKNTQEQQLVTDFIEDTLRAHHLRVNSRTTTKRAGHLEHICTHIESSISAQTDVFTLLRDLSPTPAVSGYPRHQALKEISDIERIDRWYYGGWCGPVAPDGVETFVTLRCMRITPDTGICELYGGGGITPLSDPQDEWQEAQSKINTLAHTLGIK